MAAEGALVGVLDIDADRCADVCAEIQGIGGSAVALAADVSDEAAMCSAVAAFADSQGRLDGVVVAAGINGVWAPVDDLSYAEWNRTLAINLSGTFLALHLSVPHLKSTGGGSIVIVSSINGVRTFTSAGAIAYGSSKAGQVALAQQLALELAQHHIRVNVVCPGYTATGIGAAMVNRNTALAAFPASYPAGDVPLTGGLPATPEDVAGSVTFLMSDSARHISGTQLFVDGAQSILR
jgi:NAD(P)-dependent dehydrogenase (short-subunit alcohol dehydrogenase family)